MKTCKRCNIEKDYTEFYKEKNSKDGFRGSCKSCMSDYQSSIDKNHRKDICKKSYYKNIDDKKLYYKSNSEKIKQRRLERYYENKEFEQEYAKEYAKNNRTELNKYRRDYEKLRIETDNLYKFIRSIRSLIFISVTKNGYTKKSKTSTILGCSFEEFKIYIESKFEDWMDWENHGKCTGSYNETWHLDHIVPISSAKNESEVIKLNHYTNFQPICSKRNLEKSNKIK
jgi:hypothetical protein